MVGMKEKEGEKKRGKEKTNSQRTRIRQAMKVSAKKSHLESVSKRKKPLKSDFLVLADKNSFRSWLGSTWLGPEDKEDKGLWTHMIIASHLTGF